MMTYMIVNQKGQKLSGFDIGNMATKHQLRFRTRDWYTYSTLKEAQEHLRHIRKECRQKKEAEKLRIVKYR